MPPISSSDSKRHTDNVGGFFSRVGKRISAFWQRVTEGLEIQILWSQFVAEARASYSLYSREVDWEALRQKTRARRALKLARRLFWAMLTKLSPRAPGLSPRRAGVRPVCVAASGHPEDRPWRGCHRPQ